MDRFKEFLRTKGLYIAIGTGVLAFVGLMVIYNYNTYKREFGVDKQAVDLNTPEVTETTEQIADTKVEMPDVADANSNEAVAGDTDADNKEAKAEDSASNSAQIDAEEQSTQ